MTYFAELSQEKKDSEHTIKATGACGALNFFEHSTCKKNSGTMACHLSVVTNLKLAANIFGGFIPKQGNRMETYSYAYC